MKTYDTVTEALKDLKLRGFTIDFNIAFDKIICSENKICLNPNEFEITEVYRFEGETDPGDENVVYAIESKDNNVKGSMSGAYGTYAESISTEMIKKLSMRK
jgi:hypothetical protein